MAALTTSTLGMAALGMAGVSAGASIIGGIEARREASKQAAIAEAQANLQAAETARAGERDAMAVSAEAESTRRRQKLAFLKSGVDLAGSPLALMEATRLSGLDNAEEVRRAGGMTAGAQIMEGRAKASSLKASGRQAFISGIANAASTGMSAAGVYSGRAK